MPPFQQLRQTLRRFAEAQQLRSRLGKTRQQLLPAGVLDLGERRDEAALALHRADIALRLQLEIGAADRVRIDGKRRRQLADRGELLPGLQRSAQNFAPQALLELCIERPRVMVVQNDQAAASFRVWVCQLCYMP